MHSLVDIWVVLMLLQLRNLSEQTGMYALAFFTCSHIHDNMMPSLVDSDDAVAFLSEVLDIDPMDFLAKFEQWACARTKGTYCGIVEHFTHRVVHLAYAVQENLQTLRCDCTRIISNGLHK